MNDWLIVYEPLSDGTVPTFSSEDGQPWEAPGYGVEGILQGPPGDPQLISRDFYLCREDYGCWIEVDQFGLVDHFVSAARYIVACLAGRTVPPGKWKEAMRCIDDSKRQVG